MNKLRDMLIKFDNFMEKAASWFAIGLVVISAILFVLWLLKIIE
jgi:hypothetical protein